MGAYTHCYSSTIVRQRTPQVSAQTTDLYHAHGAIVAESVFIKYLLTLCWAA